MRQAPIKKRLPRIRQTHEGYRWLEQSPQSITFALITGRAGNDNILWPVRSAFAQGDHVISMVDIAYFLFTVVAATSLSDILFLNISRRMLPPIAMFKSASSSFCRSMYFWMRQTIGSIPVPHLLLMGSVISSRLLIAFCRVGCIIFSPRTQGYFGMIFTVLLVIVASLTFSPLLIPAVVLTQFFTVFFSIFTLPFKLMLKICLPTSHLYLATAGFTQVAQSVSRSFIGVKVFKGRRKTLLTFRALLLSLWNSRFFYKRWFLGPCIRFLIFPIMHVRAFFAWGIEAIFAFGASVKELCCRWEHLLAFLAPFITIWKILGASPTRLIPCVTNLAYTFLALATQSPCGFRVEKLSSSRKVLFTCSALLLRKWYTVAHSKGQLLIITPLGYVQYPQGHHRVELHYTTPQSIAQQYRH
jgi:hypothetical protein